MIKYVKNRIAKPSLTRGTSIFENYNVFEIQFQKLILRCKSMRLAHILSYIASV